jgi:serine phosphatase RsbU (regulator of sigma subunit)
MADVIGHGVAAALVASMVKVAISTQRGLDGEPAKVIAGLNTILCNEAGGQYATAVYLYLDAMNGLGRYSAAAHPASLLWRRSRQKIETLGEAGLLLGVRSDEAYAECEFSFDKGDRILVYTDGLTEAENAAGQSFGETALPTFIRENQGLDAEQFVDLLLKVVLLWSRDGTQRQQEDDITILVIDT